MNRQKISEYHRMLLLFVAGLFIGNTLTHSLKLGDLLNGTPGDLITWAIVLSNLIVWYFIDRPLKKQSKQA